MEHYQRLVAALDKLEVYSMKIIPDGADRPLPLATDADAEVTEADAKRAIALWDELMPDYAGLLNAKVVNGTRA